MTRLSMLSNTDHKDLRVITRRAAPPGTVTT